MTNAIEIKNLTKTYKEFSFGPVTLDLPSGCILGLIGENGAGKSTMIRMLLGLAKPESGQITMFGSKNLDRETKEHIGVVLDESGFPESISAKNVRQILKNSYKTFDEKKYDAFLKRFSLPEKRTIKEYSRGMRMKLSIAAALSHDARLLVLDEATSGLDPIVRDELLDVFLEFIADESHSILISSHILSDLEKICDYIAFLHEGRLLFTEQKDILREKYMVMKCDEQTLNKIEPSAVFGRRAGRFGAEALVARGAVPPGVPADPASIEDIMLYFVKGKGAAK